LFSSVFMACCDKQGCIASVEKKLIDPEKRSKGYHPWDQLVGMTILLVGCACNHYARDAIGPIEWHLEELGGLSTGEYHQSLSFFFIVNVIVPLAAGIMATHYGAPAAMVVVLVFGGTGNLLVSSTVFDGVGISSDATIHYPTFLIGRTLAGFSYEAFDILGMPFIGKYYTNWYPSLLIAIAQASIRAGSVLAFIGASGLLHVTTWEVVLVVTGVVGIAPLPMALYLKRMTDNMDAEVDAATPKVICTAQVLAVPCFAGFHHASECFARLCDTFRACRLISRFPHPH